MRLAYDLGMHNGDDTNYYCSKGFAVVSVEAMPKFAEEARIRFAPLIESGVVVIENVGIADVADKMKFYINPSNTVQSSFVAPGDQKWDEIWVETTTLPTLINKHGKPDFIKIDIENYDLIALEALHRHRIAPNYISSEAHKLDVILKLYEMGYRRFRLVNCKTISSVFGQAKIRRLDGARIPFNFEKHSSGPYGDDITVFPWTEIEGVLAMWLNRQALLGRGWYDVHAAMPAGSTDMFLG